MALSPLELFQFGGVDSRSNVLNFPTSRSLRCRNWVPKDAGTLELRNGFSAVTMTGSTSATAYHSLFPYTLYDNSGNETPYLLLGQGAQLRVMNIATGGVTSPTIKGAALAGTAGFESYLANGKIHFGNGTDQKWFDGANVRDNGLRTLTATEIASMVVSYGIGEWTTEASTATVTATGTTGTFAATVGSGLFFFGVYFDTTSNEVGPASNHLASARVTVAATNKVALANLPNIAASFPNLVKLIARTGDGTDGAYFCTNTSSTITSCTRSGTVLTVVTQAAHGLSTSDVVILAGTTNFDSVYLVTVTGASTFTVVLNRTVGQNASGANSTGGTCKRIVKVAGATTTQDITDPSTDTNWLVNDTNRGIVKSQASVTAPGYQFYACLYNPTADAHVGNRIAIGGGRITFDHRINVYVSGLPDLSGTDSEWQILIGRTGDGGQLPYPCADSAGNWLATVSGQTTILVSAAGGLAGNNELPTRNGVIPSGLSMFALFGGKVAGAIAGMPTVYLSADEADSLRGDFVGRPEQSWAPNDIETFPTAQGLTGMFEEDRGVFCGTKNDGAILSELGSSRGWIGPWYGAGFAGNRSWCSTPYGKFWVTGHKQLATFQNGLPVAVSDEYQTALLAKIGDAYLSQVEASHLTDISKGVDKIVIKCLDSTGTPFIVCHDFRLRDERSGHGQGYEAIYSAPLATNFILSRVRDSAGTSRLWAGASSGQIYQLESGANDAGTEFSAEALFPINAGPNRPSVPEFMMYCDQKVVLSIAKRLDASIASTASSSFQVLTQEAVDGEDGNSYYKYKQTDTKVTKGFLRIQLDSHSIDGDLTLSDPPHVPLETYGRIYLGQGLIGQRQGA